mgnify:CR=1 FL=1
MIVLQQGTQFFAEPDPIHGIVFGGIFIGLLIIAVIGTRISANAQRSGSGDSPRFSRFALRRAARKTGLDRFQTRLLEQLAREQGIAEPKKLLTSRNQLDRAIRRGLRAIDSANVTETEQQQRRFHLLNLRRELDSVRADKGESVDNTAQLRSGNTFTLITETKAQYQCRLTANAESMLVLEAPQTPGGETIVWDKRTPLKVTFRGADGTLFGFRSYVLGYRKQRASHQLFIAHSDTVRSVQKRKSPRREFRRPTYFYPIRVVQSGSGKNAKREAVVDDSRRDLGTIEDISAGGCAMRVRGALKAGSLIKLSFEMKRGTPVAVYGKVRGTDAGYRGNLMHIMFTRVSRANMAAILEYVYGYIDQE